MAGPRSGRFSSRSIPPGARSAIRWRAAASPSPTIWRNSRTLSAGPGVSPADLTRVGDALKSAVDPVHGGLERRAEIPQCADLPLLLERDVPPRRSVLRRGVARHARGDERGRHLRSSRRRLRALFDRRRMARAAFREDALRQRADPRIAGARPFPVARSDLRRAGARDGRVADARDAGRRRFRRLARRRSGRRGGPVLRLGRRGGRRRARRGGEPRSRPPTM